MLMETEPNTENVVYIDEYPELAERVRLRRMGQMTLFSADLLDSNVLTLFDGDEPDGAA